MFGTRPRLAYALSAILILLMALATAGGLFIDGLYRDNAYATAAWRGTDLVSLLIAVPLLTGSVILSMRGSPHAQLVWLGMLDYTLYNYAYYLFGAAFNHFFLIYVALFTLSMFALIFGVAEVDIRRAGQQFHARTRVRGIAAYMLFVAAGIGGLWIVQSLSFVASGQVPQFIVDVAHPTSVVFALDLSLVVPFLVLGAVWLWQRRPWGYLLAAVLSVKGAVYMLALSSVSLFARGAGFPDAAAQLPLWGLLAAGFAVATLIVLGNVKPSPETRTANAVQHE